MIPATIRNRIEHSGHGRESPLVKKAGALAKDVMIGAGEVWKIFSDVALDSGILSDSSSVNEAVGSTGPGAVSNGSLHIVGQSTAAPL